MVAISKEAPAEYYDFHVPIFNNYWACGLWHHNSGKSAIVEAVSVAFWGRTIRGESPWQAENVGEVHIELCDGAWVKRKHQAAIKGRVSFARDAAATPVVHSTATKAQEELSTIVGEWETWRRAACFTSVDTAGFSNATDFERIKLIENVLGLDALALAHERCKEAQRALNLVSMSATTRASSLTERVSAAQEQVAYAQSRVEAAAKIIPVGSASSAVTGAKVAKLQAGKANIANAMRADSSLLTVASTVLRQAQVKCGLAENKLQEARASKERVSVGVCSECQQPLPDASSKQAHAALHLGNMQKVLLEARAAAEAAEAEYTRLSECVEEHSTMLAEISGALEDATAKHSAALRREDVSASASDEANASLERAQIQLAELASALAIAKADLARVTHEKAVLEAVEKALGRKGVRAQVLSKAIPGFVQASNLWLSALSAGAMSLSIGAEERDGALSTLPLSITGAGNGFGYRAASQGERRRVDVALVLGLAEMASGFAIGSTPSTLFFDEVADSLDSEGVERMADVLHQLARNRCVVLITHNPEMLDAVRPTKHWVVKRGCVSVV